jgi:hypothetical protein
LKQLLADAAVMSGRYLPPPLFPATLYRHAVRSEIDRHALRRMAVLIELVAQYGDRNHQSADDKIERVVARHGRSLPSRNHKQ